jgi:hypothetical protein
MMTYIRGAGGSSPPGDGAGLFALCFYDFHLVQMSHSHKTYKDGFINYNNRIVQHTKYRSMQILLFWLFESDALSTKKMVQC